MKICSQCGQVNDDDARFCVRDGWKLPDSVDEASQEDKSNNKACEKCGFENSPEVKFCGGCGRPLGENMKKKEKDINIPGYVKLFFFLFIIIVGLCIAANTYDKDLSELFEVAQGVSKEATYLNVSKNRIGFQKDGQAFDYDKKRDLIGIDAWEIFVDTDGKWEVVSPGWCSVKMSKTSFIVSCKPNIMHDKMRIDTIRVVAAQFEEKILVGQLCEEYYVLGSSETINVDDRGGTFEFDVFTNEKDYSLWSEKNNWEWINVRKVGKKITFEISQNSGSMRKAYIDIGGKHASFELKIKQDGSR